MDLLSAIFEVLTGKSNATHGFGSIVTPNNPIFNPKYAPTPPTTQTQLAEKIANETPTSELVAWKMKVVKEMDTLDRKLRTIQKRGTSTVQKTSKESTAARDGKPRVTPIQMKPLWTPLSGPRTLEKRPVPDEVQVMTAPQTDKKTKPADEKETKVPPSARKKKIEMEKKYRIAGKAPTKKSRFASERKSKQCKSAGKGPPTSISRQKNAKEAFIRRMRAARGLK